VFALTLNPERVDAAFAAKPIDVLDLSPLSKDAPSVLDVGTETEIWAINFGELCSASATTGPCCLMKILGDKYKAAIVKGIDLSPIQPQW